MEYEVLSTTKPKTVKEEVEPGSGHKDGEVKVTPYTGYKVQTYKCKYDKETKKLISRDKEAYSVYAKRDKVVYKIKETEPTTEPTQAPTKPTEPTTKPTEETKPEETTKPTAPKPDKPTETTQPEETGENPKPPIEEATG